MPDHIRLSRLQRLAARLHPEKDPDREEAALRASALAYYRKFGEWPPSDNFVSDMAAGRDRRVG